MIPEGTMYSLEEFDVRSEEMIDEINRSGRLALITKNDYIIAEIHPLKGKEHRVIVRNSSTETTS